MAVAEFMNSAMLIKRTPPEPLGSSTEHLDYDESSAQTASQDLRGLSTWGILLVQPRSPAPFAL